MKWGLMELRGFGVPVVLVDLPLLRHHSALLFEIGRATTSVSGGAIQSSSSAPSHEGQFRSLFKALGPEEAARRTLRIDGCLHPSGFDSSESL